MLDANTSDAEGGVGQYAIGYFTPGGSTASIAFNGLSQPAISAFQLRQIPEPSTYAFLSGLTVLGLTFLRRRKSA
jgi:hypothetical protein